MKQITIQILTVFCLTTNAQTWQWAKSAGDTLNDYTTSTTADSLGNIYVAGYFYSPTITFGSYTLTNTSIGTSNIYIAKYDASGNVLWAQTAIGNDIDILNSITTDSVGNVFATGHFLSDSIKFGTTTLFNSTGFGSSLFIVKYNSNGKVVWARTASGSSIYTFGNAITTDNTGNIYVAGQFSVYSIIFDTITVAWTGAGDQFIAKFDAAGNVIWAKGFNTDGDGNEVPQGVKADNFGNVFLVGYFSSATGITFGNNPPLICDNYQGSHIYIVKLDRNGVPLWSRGIREGSGQYVRSLAVDASGNAIITGNFSSSSIILGTDTLFNTNVYDDMFIARYDSSGNVAWARSATGIMNEEGSSVALDVSGNSYVAGYFTSDSVTFGNHTIRGTNDSTGTKADIFLTKYDINGNVVWAISAGSNYFDAANCVCLDIYGDIYIAGRFNSVNLGFSGDTLSCDTANYTMDIFIAKLSTPTGINEQRREQNIFLFPNPFSNESILQTDRMMTNATLTIYNSHGQTMLKRENLTGQTVTVHRGNLQDGLYLLRLTEGNKVISTGKLIIVD